MYLTDFDFALPKELIAQHPCHKRDHSNLLVVNNQKLIQTAFYNIIDYFKPGDLIIFNNSKVIKAKIVLKTSSKTIEIYLNKQLTKDIWHGFAKPARKLAENEEFDIANHKLIIVKKLEMGQIHVKFLLNKITIFEFFEQHGQIPLPPYIKRVDANLEDELLYQTVYGTSLGSVAAPTAGLHFTEELLDKIKSKNIHTEYITLHVGAGTFLPVKTDNLAEHKMHSEYYEISEKAAATITKALKEQRRIIAVGTTALRALESAYLNNAVQVGQFETTIFIKPGFKFNVVNMLITNFHLPKSTLFILACAFAGYQTIKSAYDYAIEQKFRFFSYGDAMLLHKNSEQDSIPHYPY